MNKTPSPSRTVLRRPSPWSFPLVLLAALLLMTPPPTTTAFVNTPSTVTTKESSTFPLSAKKTASSSTLEEALDSFPFQFRPDNELPGTKGRPKFACSKKQATACYKELEKLYGSQEALQMIQIQPIVLTFDSKNFAPCLDAWTEQFGLPASQKMVQRNPGLLGVKPILAAEPAEATMALSYLVWVTRPLPKIIAAGGILAILTGGLR